MKKYKWTKKIEKKTFYARVFYECGFLSLNESINLWMQISSSLILDNIAPTKQLTPLVKAKSLTRP